MSGALRVAIVDDEPLVRRGLRRWLERADGVALVGEAGDGAAAVRLLERERPDLVFLDVQMPEADGFAVLEALEPADRPAVIFVTAYDEYAIRAFDVHAVDYLLKPFDDERLATALGRARERLGSADPRAATDRVGRLLDDLAATRPVRRLPVRTGRRIFFLDVDEIDWLEASGNYVRVHAGEGSHLVREPLGALLERLGDGFARVHRSTAVRLSRVAELRPLESGDARLFLADGTELRVSRTFRAEFERRMEGG